MTVDKLTFGSTDLLALAETVNVTMIVPPPERYEHSYEKISYPVPEWATKRIDYKWESVNDTTVRPEHHNRPVWPMFGWPRTAFVFDCTTTRSPSFAQSVGRLIRKALRTYPKRMSRAKRKEARAREQRRRIKDNQWWSKR